MDLSYIVKKQRDDQGDAFERHFLVDADSSRAWGYVETPTVKELMFMAGPYEGRSRWYTTMEAAKSYLEQIVIEQDLQECEQLTKNVKTADEPVETKP